MKVTIQKYLSYLPWSLWPFLVTLLFSLLWILFIYNGSMNRLFITSDHLASKAYEKKNYLEAAGTFENSLLKGASFYRAGEFKKAKAIYQNLSSKEGQYNLGNSWVMLGKYDPAIKAYELALKIDPDFKEAKDNLIVAKARKLLKESKNDGAEGVGELGADEIVYDNKASKGVNDDTSAEKERTSGNANWLDRLQTGPKGFLKNKFRYQYEMQRRKDAK